MPGAKERYRFGPVISPASDQKTNRACSTKIFAKESASCLRHAGHKLESILAAHGSGASALSRGQACGCT